MRTVTLAALLLLLVAALAVPVLAQNPTLTPVPIVPTVMFGDVFPTAAPLSVPTVSGPVPSLSGVGATPITQNVNIRSGPGTDYPILRVLRFGRSIDVVGTNGYDLTRSCAGDFNTTLDMWIVVQWGGRRGWAARCTVVSTGDMSRLLVHAAPDPDSVP